MSHKDSSEKLSLDEENKNSETNGASFVTKLELADIQVAGITNLLGLDIKINELYFFKILLQKVFSAQTMIRILVLVIL